MDAPTASDWLTMQGAGGMLSAFSAFMGAQAQKTSLGFQADIDSINATASERAAQAALLAGQRQEQQSMLATANLKSTQQAGFASRGVDLGEGSAARTIVALAERRCPAGACTTLADRGASAAAAA